MGARAGKLGEGALDVLMCGFSLSPSTSKELSGCWRGQGRQWCVCMCVSTKNSSNFTFLEKHSEELASFSGYILQKHKWVEGRWVTQAEGLRNGRTLTLCICMCELNAVRPVMWGRVRQGTCVG